MTAVDRALKGTPSKSVAPPSLHSSIMRAVRNADHQAAEAPSYLSLLTRLLPVPIGAIALLGVCWLLFEKQAPPPRALPRAEAQTWSVALSPFEVRDEVARTVPSALIAPLSDELKRINTDLESTAKFLLASLP